MTLRLAHLIPIVGGVALWGSTANAGESPGGADLPPLPVEGARGVTEPSNGPHGGLELGGRLGVAVPLGLEVSGLGFSAGKEWAWPVWIDLGARVSPHVFFGGYGQVAHVGVRDSACPAGASCSLMNYKIGLAGHYHFAPAEEFDPWVGLGLGYEWLHRNGSDADGSRAGVEFMAMLGLDYRFSAGFGVGPYAAVSVGEFATEPTRVRGASTSGTIDEATLHEWITVGVRVVFNR